MFHDDYETRSINPISLSSKHVITESSQKTSILIHVSHNAYTLMKNYLFDISVIARSQFSINSNYPITVLPTVPPSTTHRPPPYRLPARRTARSPSAQSSGTDDCELI